MMAFFQGNAIDVRMSQNDVPSHLAVCGVKIGQCDGVFAEKHRPKALVLPDHNYTGTDAYNRPSVHFFMHSIVLFITELWTMRGIQHDRKDYVFRPASIAFCPQRQLVRAYP